MDFLNKAFAQLADLFRSMTAGARITAGLLLIVIVVSLYWLVNNQVSGPDAFLFGGEPIASQQIAVMEAAFDKAGLTDYDASGNRIRVPRGQQSRYMGALADANALPPNFGDLLTKALEQSGPFVSRQKQAEIMNVARQQALGLMIREMGNGTVQDASVLYDSRTEKGLSSKQISTAAVMVKLKGNQPLSEDRVLSIQNLVARSFAGLKPEDVAVMDGNLGRTYVADGPNGTTSGMGDRYGALKKFHEEEWQTKIRNALAYISGVVVTANVELDSEIEHNEQSTEYDQKTVPFAVTESTSLTKEQGPAPQGRPGLPAQGAIPNAAAQVGMTTGPTTEKETSATTQRNLAPTKTRVIRKAPLTPKEVTVSVAVPSSYFERIWHAKNPAPAGEAKKTPPPAEIANIEKEKITAIQELVNNLIPRSAAGTDPYPRVQVASFVDIVPEASPPPPFTDQMWVWVGQYGSTVGMTCVGLFSLLILRSMVRSTATADQGGATASMHMAVQTSVERTVEEEDLPGTPAPQRRKRRAKAGPSLRDELAEIVKEDPDSAANVLRSWIGTAN